MMEDLEFTSNEYSRNITDNIHQIDNIILKAKEDTSGFLSAVYYDDTDYVEESVSDQEYELEDDCNQDILEQDI
jgi:hypothetical protein